MRFDYPISHFSLTLPRTENVANIPKLLIHLSTILTNEYNDITVQDIIFHLDEEDENGDKLPSVTVYYSIDSNDEAETMHGKR